MLKKYRNSPTARLPLYYLNLRYGYLIIKCEEISWKKLNQRTGIINIRFYFCFYRNTVVQLVYIHEWEWNNIGAVVSKQAQCILCVGYKFKSTHLVRLVGGPL